MAISDVTEYTHLTPEEVEQIGRELDAIRARVEESRGAADAAYINRLIRIQRGLAAAGRVTLLAGSRSRRLRKPAWVAGAALLGRLRGVPLPVAGVDLRVVHPVVLAVHDVVPDLHVVEDLR